MTSKAAGAVEKRRPTILEIAEAIAPGWERHRPFIEEVAAPVRTWMIRELATRAGTTVLELGAGAGDTGFEAAAELGEDGRLISSDLSPSMLDAARRRAVELGLENVDFREIDAERIPLETDSVDGVLCRFAYMLMPDPAAALAETRRVLRAGGRLALAVWGATERNPYFAVPAQALVAAGHLPPPGPGVTGPFTLADPDRVSQLLHGAGFDHVRVEPVEVRFGFRDLDECLAITADTSGPIGLALRALPDDQRRAIAGTVAEAFGPFATGAGYALPGEALCAVAH